MNPSCTSDFCGGPTPLAAAVGWKRCFPSLQIMISDKCGCAQLGEIMEVQITCKNRVLGALENVLYVYLGLLRKC